VTSRRKPLKAGFRDPPPWIRLRSAHALRRSFRTVIVPAKAGVGYPNFDGGRTHSQMYSGGTICLTGAPIR
jgi:hypothetical protein